MPSFEYIENGVNFEVYRKNRKTLGLFISHRKVEIRVPKYASKKKSMSLFSVTVIGLLNA